MEYAIRLFFAVVFSPVGLLLPLGLGVLTGLISGYFVGNWAFAIGGGVALTVRLLQAFSALSKSW